MAKQFYHFVAEVGWSLKIIDSVNLKVVPCFKTSITWGITKGTFLIICLEHK
jgi:hypothetical protein